MDKEIKKVYDQAVLARQALASAKISYDVAFAIVKKYTDMANVKAKVIAKRFGKKAYPIDPRGFLR